MQQPLLDIKDIHAQAEEREILRGVTLQIASGETVALLGPNGSGKSTLAHVLAGHPGYTVTRGSITYRGNDLLAQKPEERARAGLFLAFQYPQAIAGVTVSNFLRLAYTAVHGPVGIKEFLALLKEKMELLQLAEEFMYRPVNEGFSGGEKKRLEMLQLAVLAPRLAVLDETDSGLDVDALQAVGAALRAIRLKQPELSLLIITHHQRILETVTVDRVAVMKRGVVVQEGTREILALVAKEGFAKL